MDVGAAFVAGGQSAEGVKPGEGAFDRPAPAAQARAVAALASGDAVSDAALAQKAAVLVVVVAAVGDDAVWSPPRSADAAAHGRHPVEQREQLGDVIAVAGRKRPGQRQPAAVYEEMLLAAAPAAVDGAGTRLRAPFFA